MKALFFGLLLLPVTVASQDGWKYIGPEEKETTFLTIHGDVIYTSVIVDRPGGGFKTSRIYRSFDAGMSWEVVDSTLIPRTATIKFLGGNPPRLIGGNGSTLYYSDDLGMTWDSKYHQNIPPFSRYYVKENVPGLIFAIGALGPGGQLESLYRSTDYGRSWAETYDFPKSTDGSRLAVGLSTTTPDIYVNADTDIGGQYFYHSPDDGVTWNYVTFSRYIMQMTVDPDDPLTIIATIAGTIQESRDGGLTWNQIYDRGMSVIRDNQYTDRLFSIRENTGLQKGILFSMDRGRTWHFDSSSFNLPFKSISGSFEYISWLQYDPGRRRLYLQTTRGIYMRENFLTSLTEEAGALPTGPEVYPQPASTFAAFSFSFIKQPVRLKVFNTFGEVVYEREVSNNGNDVWNLVDMYGRAVPSGLYFIVLQSGYDIHTSKLLIQR